jgi:hypothetical protein
MEISFSPWQDTNFLKPIFKEHLGPRKNARTKIEICNLYSNWLEY